MPGSAKKANNAFYKFDAHRLSMLDNLLKKVLKDIKPDKKEIERLTACSNELMSRLRAIVPKSVEIITAGSIAHGTHLKGSSDIDIFMLFPKENDERSMERRALEFAKKIVDKGKNESYEIKYAEHPYLRLFLGDLDVSADIVPAFKIRDASEMGSAVDRTQLHTEFVVSHLSEKQKDEVRLLKYFLGQHDIYGAEAMTEGFSGYLCELLVYHYGSFAKLIEGFARLRLPIAIYPETRAVATGKQLEELAKRFSSNFIVIDPTDKERNVAANVSVESLARLTLLARRLLKYPVEKVFFREEYGDISARTKIAKFEKLMGSKMYTITMRLDDIAEDILWQQIKKLKNRIEVELSREGFTPILSLQSLEEDRGVIAFFIERNAKRVEVVQGPSVFMPEAAEKFANAHAYKALAGTLKAERLIYFEKPAYREPESLIRSLLRSKQGMPSHIRKGSIKVMSKGIEEEYAKMLYKRLVFATTI
ncbi:MAG: CCA tRNA nucleotidyltransferase [Candidatus Micrarchaeia archaeon]